MQAPGRWSEATYEQALRRSPIGVALVAPDGTWLWVNDALCTLLGRSADELHRLTFQDVTHPDDLDADEQLVADVIAGRRDSYQMLKRYLDPQGRAIPALLSVALVRDVAGAPVHFVSQIVDLRVVRAQENLTAAVLDAAEDVLVAATDLEGVVTLFSRGAERLLGYRAQDVVGRATPALWFAPDPSPTSGSTGTAERTTDPETGVKRLGDVPMVRSDGSRFVAEQTTAPLFGPDGSMIGTVGIARDVTVERELQVRLDEMARMAQLQLSSVITSLGLGAFTRDLGTGLVQVNASLAAMYGLERTVDVPMTDIIERVHPDDRSRIAARADVTRTPEGYEDQYRVVHPDGSERHVRVYARRIDLPSGTGHVVGITVDETERVALLEAERRAREDAERSREALEFQALHDSLTGLPNRQLLLHRLEHALRRRTSPGVVPAVLLFVDLDRFKVVNDSLGHAAGDRLLVEAARRLRAAVRPEDLVARLGGDEFVVVLEDVPSGREEELARRVLGALGEPYVIEGHVIPASASVGIALGQPGMSPGELLRDADAAMYVAKGRGRSGIARFDDAVRTAALSRLELVSDLHHAGERGELVVHYQPAFHPGGTIEGLEALVRWRHPERGLLGPAAFLPFAEESGEIVEVGRWLRGEVCAQVGRWRDHGVEVPRVWVNVSAVELRDHDVAHDLLVACTIAGLTPNDVGVEVTESVLMAPEESSRLDDIAAAGFAVAVDDFGTGYSSLAYLTRHRVDVLKVDRSFVARVVDDPASAAVVQAVVDLARTLQARSIAEGVETPQQHAALVAAGCDAMCGYLMARPAPAEVVVRLLRDARLAC